MHVSQLAQDIQTSLKASSQRRFLLKIRAQYRRPTETNTRPSTNTIKDPKDKSVIGEPSKQTTSEIKYFQRHENDHVAAQPTRNLLTGDAELEESNLEDVYGPE